MDVPLVYSSAVYVLFLCLKVFVAIRIITYGTSNVSRYLLYKHGWRWHGAGGGGTLRPQPPIKEVITHPFIGMANIASMIGLFGIFEWVYIGERLKVKEGETLRPASNLEVTVYTLLPLRIMSRVWGTLTSIDLPVFIRPKILSFYAQSFGVNLDECKIQDLSCYRNLSEFFIRPLRDECRPIDSHPHGVASPADGRILNFGKVSSCQVDQVKGITYSLQQFLGEPTWLEEYRTLVYTTNGYRRNRSATSDLSNDQYLKRLKTNPENELYQCVVYLAPGDYHRFHSPVSWVVTFRRHFQGKLLSVNPAIASWIRDLFSLNERAAYVGHWKHGFFSLTAVGATNVGSIKVTFDPSLHTNRWTVKPRHRDLALDGIESTGVTQPSIDTIRKSSDTTEGSSQLTEKSTNEDRGMLMEKGELFGEFRLGSTIVIIFEAPKNFEFNLKQGQKIKFGERLGAVL